LDAITEFFPSFEHGVLIMDRDKGGEEAVRYGSIFFCAIFEISNFILFATSEIVPEMEIQSCVTHLKENVKTKFGEKAATTFSTAARQSTKIAFIERLGSLAIK
jgi:hypothetical protein